MAISRYEDMNDMKIDVLKEMGSIGGGNAATALSSMLGAKFQFYFFYYFCANVVGNLRGRHAPHGPVQHVRRKG